VGLAKVEVLVASEAFNEFAARIGNIVSCSAWAEINLVARDSGPIVLSDRTTTRRWDERVRLGKPVCGRFRSAETATGVLY